MSLNVIDSPPGSGKTTWAIQYMNESISKREDRRFIFITPFLAEIDRVVSSCPSLDFEAPNVKRGRGRKSQDLLQLIREGKNICSTHALFANINDEMIQILRARNYTLILDEVMNVLEEYKMFGSNDFVLASNDYIEQLTKNDLSVLQDKGFIEVDEEFRVTWTGDSLMKYRLFENLSKRGLLHIIDSSVLLWSFPSEVFRPGIFDDVYILTYQFGYQIQRYYYDYHHIDFDVYSVFSSDDDDYKKRKYFISNTEFNDREFIKGLKEKISILYNDKMNKVGEPYFTRETRYYSSLSKTWYDGYGELLIPILAKNMSNFFGNITGSVASERMWTCFSSHRAEFGKEKNISPKHWLALNSRATNQWGDRNTLAYMVNRYPQPYIESFFRVRNININNDTLALSEMLQWIFRSAIRNNQEIQIYVPSWRMRRLLELYLDGKDLSRKNIYDDSGDLSKVKDSGWRGEV